MFRSCIDWVAHSLAFHPPTPPSYQLTKAREGEGLLAFADGWAPTVKDPDAPRSSVTAHLIRLRTARGQSIVAAFFRVASPRRTILYSHGNATDLGEMRVAAAQLAAGLACDVLMYDYAGYGQSSGEPSELDTYADVAAAYAYLVSTCGVPPGRVVLYGQSLGSGPTVDLAAREASVAAVVLHSPLLSGVRVLYPSCAMPGCMDIYPNHRKIRKVRSPVLIVHGECDAVISIDHGRALHEACRAPTEPLWVAGAGHNDIESLPAYLRRLRSFFNALDAADAADAAAAEAAAAAASESATVVAPPPRVAPLRVESLRAEPPQGPGATAPTDRAAVPLKPGLGSPSRGAALPPPPLPPRSQASLLGVGGASGGRSAVPQGRLPPVRMLAAAAGEPRDREALTAAGGGKGAAGVSP